MATFQWRFRPAVSVTARSTSLKEFRNIECLLLTPCLHWVRDRTQDSRRGPAAHRWGRLAPPGHRSREGTRAQDSVCTPAATRGSMKPIWPQANFIAEIQFRLAREADCDRSWVSSRETHVRRALKRTRLCRFLRVCIGGISLLLAHRQRLMGGAVHRFGLITYQQRSSQPFNRRAPETRI